MALNKGNLRFCTIEHNDTTYDVAVVVSSLDELDNILQEWAIATIGETLNLPEELIANKDATEVVTALDVDNFAYLKSPVSKYMDMPRSAGVSGEFPALPVALDANGLYAMPSIKVFLYSEAGYTGYFGEYSVEAATLQLVAGANILCVAFNNGVPIYQAYTDLSSVDDSSVIPVAYVLSFAGALFVTPLGQAGYGLAEKLLKLNRLLNRFEIVGGFGLTVTNLYVALSSLVVSNGIDALTTLDMDTSLSTNDLYMFYRDASSAWQNTKVAQLSNTKCQGTGLVDMTAGQFVVHHLYRVPSKLLLFTVPSAAFATAQDAINSAIPAALPAEISSSAVLVGRAIIGQGATTAIVQKVQKTAFGI